MLLGKHFSCASVSFFSGWLRQQKQQRHFARQPHADVANFSVETNCYFFFPCNHSSTPTRTHELPWWPPRCALQEEQPSDPLCPCLDTFMQNRDKVLGRGAARGRSHMNRRCGRWGKCTFDQPGLPVSLHSSPPTSFVLLFSLLCKNLIYIY